MSIIALRARAITNFTVRGTHTVSVERLMKMLTEGEAKDYFNLNEIVVVSSQGIDHAKALLAKAVYDSIKAYVSRACVGEDQVHLATLDPHDFLLQASYVTLQDEEGEEIHKVFKPIVLEEFDLSYPN
jgi:hypothetical protein